MCQPNKADKKLFSDCKCPYKLAENCVNCTVDAIAAIRKSADNGIPAGCLIAGTLLVVLGAFGWAWGEHIVGVSVYLIAVILAFFSYRVELGRGIAFWLVDKKTGTLHVVAGHRPKQEWYKLLKEHGLSPDSTRVYLLRAWWNTGMSPEFYSWDPENQAWWRIDWSVKRLHGMNVGRTCAQYTSDMEYKLLPGEVLEGSWASISPRAALAKARDKTSDKEALAKTVGTLEAVRSYIEEHIATRKGHKPSPYVQDVEKLLREGGTTKPEAEEAPSEMKAS